MSDRASGLTCRHRVALGYQTMECGDYTTLYRALSRGLRRQCPRCGQGAIFQRWYTLNDTCDRCKLDFRDVQGQTWGFMYISTAFLTGVIALGMFWIIPANVLAGRFVVFLLAIALIVGTLPYRKGAAIALDYWLTRRVG